MGFNFLYAAQPAGRVFPTVVKPIVPISTQQKTVFTAIVLFIYLICSQIPLYGIQKSYTSDPFYWTRVILASSRGTLMQLGISPIISAGWMIQIIQAMGFLKVNSVKDQKTLDGIQKVLALIFCFGQASGQIWYGAYGNPSSMSYLNIILIIMQLMMAGVVVIMLDQVLRKGYGLGSGISLFIVANTSQTIFWQIFSPVTLNSEYGVQFQGCFVCFVHFLTTKPSKWAAIILSFTRTEAPNLSQLMGTITIFFIVIYLQGFHKKIPLIHQRHRGYSTQIKIKLFYTSNMSVILQSMVVSNLYNISAILSSRFKNSIIVKIFGEWQNGKAIGGITYYISPPQGMYDLIIDPIRSIIYISFVCITCAFFARFWIQISKSTPKQIAKQIREQQLTLPSYRQQSVYSVLEKYIPTAAMLGGIVIGFLTILGDLMNVIGSSTGILLSVNILYGFYQKMGNKKKADSIEY